MRLTPFGRCMRSWQRLAERLLPCHPRPLRCWRRTRPTPSSVHGIGMICFTSLATIAAVAALVSWNFRHIVRLDKIRLFNGVNAELGYPPLAIYSPREVTTYEQDETDSSR